MTADDRHLQEARILIMGGGEENIRLLEDMLRRAGYEHLRSTMDTDAVLGLAEAIRPDLLLLDLRVPGPDGFEILELLPLAVPSLGDLPVLLLTAEATDEAQRHLLWPEAGDFCSDP